MASHKTAAIKLAQQGLPIFPCNPANKRPITKHGFKDATTDIKQIESWWNKYSDAIIGMPTGKVTGKTVVDLDNKNGKTGTQKWEILCAKHNVEPYNACIRVLTPTGGEHLYFDYDPIVITQADKIAIGIDTRNDGGYVIVPPSKTSKGEYKLISKKRSVSVPEFVTNFHKVNNNSLPVSNTAQSTINLNERIYKFIDKMPLAVSGQGGHNATFNVAMILVEGFGLSIAEAMKYMHYFNNKLVEKWTEKELLHKLEDALKKVNPAKVGSFNTPIEVAKPINQPSVNFDAEENTSKKPVWEMITDNDVKNIIENTLLGDIAHTFEVICKPSLPFGLNFGKAIVFAGTALCQEEDAAILEHKGNVYGVQRCSAYINTMGGQPIQFYVLQVAPSGSGKDISDLLATTLSSKNPTNNADAKNYIGGIASEEGLLDTLMESPTPLVFIDELKQCLDEKSYQHKVFNSLTSIFSKRSFFKPLSKRISNHVRKADFCIPNVMGNIQDKIFENNIPDELFSDGGMNRFLIVNGAFTEWYENPDFPVVAAIEKLSAIYDNIQMIECVVTPDVYYPKSLIKIFKENNAPYVNYWNRLSREYYPRIACLLGLDIENRTISISAQNWKDAQKIILWFYSNAVKHFRNREVDKQGEIERENQEKILKYMKHNTSKIFTKSAIVQNIWNLNSKSRDIALRDLLESGFIEETVTGKVKKYCLSQDFKRSWRYRDI